MSPQAYAKAIPQAYRQASPQTDARTDSQVESPMDPLMRSVRSFEAARAALGMPGVSWAADLTRLDALVRRYPMQARYILRQIDGPPGPSQAQAAGDR